MINKPKTIFCDIDGTLCEYPYTGTKDGDYPNLFATLAVRSR